VGITWSWKEVLAASTVAMPRVWASLAGEPALHGAVQPLTAPVPLRGIGGDMVGVARVGARSAPISSDSSVSSLGEDPVQLHLGVSVSIENW
jgi:hypothetical protein